MRGVPGSMKVLLNTPGNTEGRRALLVGSPGTLNGAGSEKKLFQRGLMHR